MKPEHLKGLRECCQDDAAFERLQQILLACEAERQQVELQTLCRSLLGSGAFGVTVGASQGRYLESLEELILQRTNGLLDANGQLRQEIRDRERVEQALQESEQRFRSLIENATDLIVILDQQGVFRYCSPSTNRVLGYTPLDVVGHSATEFVHPSDVPLILNVLHDAIANPRVSQPAVEYRVRHSTGSWCVFEAVATSLLEDPAVQGVVINCHDITERKQAEESLRIANRQTANILESITDAFMSLDTQWRVTYVNQRAAQFCQRSQAALLGQPLWQTLPELIGSALDQQCHHAMQQQQPLTFEEFYPSLNAWFEVRVFPSTEGLSLFLLDVTERQQAQAELLEMSTALGNAVEGIARIDTQGRFAALNRAYAASVGYQPEDLIGLDWTTTVHSDDVATLEAAHQQLFTEGKVEVEVRGLRKDGSTFYKSVVMVAAYDWHDRLIGHHCFTKDISERKRAEAALRESEERLRLTLEATQMGVWNRNLVTGIGTWSESCELLYGLKPGTFDGSFEMFHQLIHPEDRDYVTHHFAQAPRLKTDSSVEFRVVWPDDSIHWLSERSHAVYDESGKAVLLLGVAMDITDRRRAEEATRQQAERERLIGLITQRIRNSLDLEETLNTTVLEVRQFLRADRVVLCRIEPNQTGLVIAESVDTPLSSMLGLRVEDEWFKQQQTHYQQGENLIITGNQSPELPAVYQQFCDRWQVKALLAVPILQGSQIWGVLIAHQCATVRQWESFEVGLLEQLATQIAIAIQQSELYRQEQQLNTALEQQVQERTAQLQQALRFEAMLKRITDSVRDSLDEDEILQTAVQELALGLEISGCNTALYDLEQQKSHVLYEYIHFNLPSAQGHVFSIAEFPEVYEQLLQAQHFQFCWTYQDVASHIHRQYAVFACPMVNDQGVMGDLWLYKPQDAVFSTLEIRLVQQVANQCAIAIRQARLFQTAQAQVAALEELNHLKDDFLSTVSHELRTPMSNMKMAIHMLKTVSTPERQARYLDILQSECLREIELINDLLDLQRLEAASYPVAHEAVDLNQCLQGIVEPFKARTSDRQQALHLNLPDSLPFIFTDKATLERILAELLNNACKYTSPGGEVTLAIHVDDDTTHTSQIEVTVAVGNTTEIPQAELPYIFEKFYRIPNADPWRQGGTGLGLALVQRLIAQLGGAIHVESQNGWTTFTIKLSAFVATALS